LQCRRALSKSSPKTDKGGNPRENQKLSSRYRTASLASTLAFKYSGSLDKYLCAVLYPYASELTCLPQREAAAHKVNDAAARLLVPPRRPPDSHTCAFSHAKASCVRSRINATLLRTSSGS